MKASSPNQRALRGVILLFFVFSVVSAIAQQSQPNSSPHYTLNFDKAPSDAFKQEWTPPAPVLTPKQIQVNQAALLGAPDLSLKFSDIPTQYEIEKSRVFYDPIVFCGGDAPNEAHLQECVSLLASYVSNGGQEAIANVALLSNFIETHPNSVFTPNACLELALIYQKTGFFRKSLEILRQIWNSTKSLDETTECRFSEISLARLLRLTGQIGLKTDLQALLVEIKDRPLGGLAKQAQLKAEELLWFFENQAEKNVFCGFIAANEICVPLGFAPIFPDVHDPEEEKEFITNGLSLYELKAHSHEGGGDLEIYKKTDVNAPLQVPCVVHWSYGHYSAVTEEKNGFYRVKDKNLEFDSWVRKELFDTEGSGYYLFSATNTVPVGYEAAEVETTKTIYGRHCIHGKDDEGDTACSGGDSSDCAMATYRFSLLNAGIIINDTPITYSPPIGGAVSVKLTYFQRSSITTDLSTVSNFGTRWTYSYLNYVDLTGSGTPSTQAKLVHGDGTFYTYSYSANNVYSSLYADRAVLTYLDGTGGIPRGYQLTYSDGSYKLFTQGNTAVATRYYLTKIVDAQGNTQTFGYDGNLRLSTISDALGQSTTFSYAISAGDNVTGDIYKIRKISDPFNRTAIFKYTNLGQLYSIEDPEGIVSSFAYGVNDFISSMTTPYGTTSFEFEELPGFNNQTDRPPGGRITATDPHGDRECVEQNDNISTSVIRESETPAPPSSLNIAGITTPFYPNNTNLHYRNTFHWDKQQMKYHEGDYTKASITNWFVDSSFEVTSISASTKSPLEGRVWYNYPGQNSPYAAGTVSAPSKTLRSVEDENGDLQWVMTQAEYDNALGNLTKVIDEKGRQVRYVYNANEIDLENVYVLTASGEELTVSYSNYVDHQPQTITYASGLVVTRTYNSKGQLNRETRSKAGESIVTDYVFDLNLDGIADEHGYVIEVKQTDPANTSNLVTVQQMTYDTVGRVRTSTDVEGYTTRFDYDNFDRVTLVTHPDSTTEQMDYTNLNLTARKDRNGLWTRYRHDSLRRVRYMQDPLGRVTTYDWCRCGDIRSVTDPLLQTTRWVRDAQGRVTSKILHDKRVFSYKYHEYSGLLKSVTNPIDQSASRVTESYFYHIDGQPAKTDFIDTNTPDVSFAYADPLGRMSSYSDQLGTTTYSYVPFTGGLNGAGEVYEINGAWDHDTIRYSYDNLGRLARREIREDTGNPIHFIEYDYDSLERLDLVTNNLGSFDHQYDSGNLSGKVDAIASSSGLTTDFEYYPTTDLQNFRRLKSIHHKNSSSATISKFEYGYDSAGRITDWKRQLGTNPTSDYSAYEIEYTSASELKKATLKNFSGTLTKQYAYQFSKSGNRSAVSVTQGGATSSIYSSYDKTNRLEQLGGGGIASIEGIVNEPSQVTVSVNGAAARNARVRSVSGTTDLHYEAEGSFNIGQNTIDITATDANGNSTEKNYAVDVAGVSANFEHDLNGNLIHEKDSSGTILKSYAWDAKNRLLSITSGVDTYLFSYDGLGRRVTETKNGTLIKKFLWCESGICMVKDASDTVLTQYFTEGEIQNGTSYLVTRDHLGSIRELVTTNGNIATRYDYSPYGKREKIAGLVDSRMGYTGHYTHESKLVLTYFRAYDPAKGRWLSIDPLGEGVNAMGNLYNYVGNDPLNWADPDGGARRRASGNRFYDPRLTPAQNRQRIRDQFRNRRDNYRMIRDNGRRTGKCPGNKARRNFLHNIARSMDLNRGTQSTNGPLNQGNPHIFSPREAQWLINQFLGGRPLNSYVKGNNFISTNFNGRTVRQQITPKSSSYARSGYQVNFQKQALGGSGTLNFHINVCRPTGQAVHAVQAR